MIRRGVTLNTEDHGKYLVKYAEENNSKMVDFLVRNGVDPNWTNKNGESALYKATQTRNEEICKLLIAKGANRRLRYRSANSSTCLSRVSRTPAALVSETDVREAELEPEEGARMGSFVHSETKEERHTLGDSEHVTSPGRKELPLVMAQRESAHCGCYY